MRLLLGGLLLVTLFLAATLWQRNWTSEARAERSAARGGGATSAAVNDLRAGWSRVVIGRPSGGEPFRQPGYPSSWPEADRDPGKEAGMAIPVHQSALPPTPTPTLIEVTVQAGQTLSRICREHYGTARHEVLDAVARHNRIASPDSLREGQKLELPPLETLLPKR